MQQIIVTRGKTVILPVSLSFNVAQDTITSDIRVDTDQTSPIIASWIVSFLNDGTEGELILTLDVSVTTAITQSLGYMDLKRVSSGEVLNLFDEPLEVIFV